MVKVYSKVASLIYLQVTSLVLKLNSWTSTSWQEWDSLSNYDGDLGPWRHLKKAFALLSSLIQLSSVGENFWRLCLRLGKAVKKVGFANAIKHEIKKFLRHRSRTATAKSCTKKCDSRAKLLRFSSCCCRHRCGCLRSLTLKTKGVFTWRWGTPGKWGNPLRWSKPPVHIISHFNLITFTW